MKKIHLILSLSAIAMLAPTQALATHFRYGILTQAPGTNSGDVTFHMQLAFRRSFFFTGTSSVLGTVFFPEQARGVSFNFGDATSIDLGGIQFRVTTDNIAEDWIFIDQVTPISHHYNTADADYTAGWTDSARWSSLTNRNGNTSTPWQLQTRVHPSFRDTSPSTSLSPIFQVTRSTASTFQVPAAAGGPGDTLRFRIANNFEATAEGLNTSPCVVYNASTAPFGCPANFSIDANTGVVTWNTSNTTTFPSNSFWTNQVFIESYNSSNQLMSSTPIDFIMQVVDASNNLPPFFTAPVCGSTIQAVQGRLTTFPVSANDPDSADPVSIVGVGLPSGANFTSTAGQPATGTFSWTPTAPGNTVLTFTATDSIIPHAQAGCSVTVAVNPPLTVSVTPSIGVCPGTPVTLTATASGGLAPYTFSAGWIQQPAPNANVATMGVVTASPGPLNFPVTVKDSASISANGAGNILVFPLPTAAISGPVAVCQGGSASLAAVPGGGSGGGYSFTWSTGATTQSISPANVLGTTTYSVSVTDSNGCHSLAASQNFTVNGLPTVTISGSPSACQNSSGSTLTANAGGGSGSYQFLWNTSATTVSISPATGTTGPANYSVQVTDANNCVGQASTQFTVNGLPTVTVSGPPTVCQGGTAQFSASPAGGSGNYQYLWNTGATTQLASANTSSAGPVTMSVSVKDTNGCSSAAAGSANLTVNGLPGVTISGPTAACQGATASLTAIPSGGSNSGFQYAWSNGATTAASAISTTAPGPASYSVTVTDSNGCASPSASANFTVNGLPAVTISGPTAACQNSTATLTAMPSGGSGGNFTYAWSTGGSSVSISPATANAGTSNISLTVTDGNNCTSPSASSQFTVNGLPTAAISGPAAVCAGGTATLNGSGSGGSGGYSFLWSTGATSASLTPQTSTAGLTGYTMTVTDSNGCKSAAASSPFTVNGLPAVSISGPSSVCQSGTVTLSANASGGSNSGYSYLWSTNAITQSITPASGTSGGVNYSVTVTDSNSCSSQASSLFTVNALPTVTITGPASACQGAAATLTGNPAGGSGSGFQYLWSTGAATASISAATASTGSTTYTLSIQDSNGCKSATASAPFTVNGLPSVSISGAPASGILTGTAVNLTANASGGSPGYSYSWSKGTPGNTPADSDTPPLGASTYGVTVTDTNSCKGAASALVNVYDFTISVAPQSSTSRRTCAAAYTVSATATGTGAPASVQLSLGTLGAGVTVLGLPATVAVGGSAPFTASSSNVGALQPISVVGSAGGGTRSASTNLNVYDYSIGLTPNPLSLATNQVGVYSASLALAPGSVAPPVIHLTAGGLPATINASIASSSLTPQLSPTVANGGATTMNISPAAPATLLPLGSFTTTISGDDNAGSCPAVSASAALNVVTVTLTSLMRDTSCLALPNGSDVVFSGSNTKLTATNPGGYMYNAAVTNKGTAASTVGFTIALPPNQDPSYLAGSISPFFIWGAQPVKVYYGDPCAPNAVDITPAGITVNGTQTQPLGGSDTQVTGSIVVPPVSIAPGQTVWVEIHNRYGLIGTIGWPADSMSTFQRGYPFSATITGGLGLTQPLETRLVETGKNVTAAGGFAIDNQGNAKGGMPVVVSGTAATCQAPSAVTQNLDGYYFVPLPAGVNSTVTLWNAVCDKAVQTATVNPASGQFVEADFTNLNPADPVIEGQVGTATAGVGGATLQLIDVAKKVVATTVSNAGGYYSFRFTQPGTYTVTMAPPAGYNAAATSTKVTVKMFDDARVDFLLTR